MSDGVVGLMVLGILLLYGGGIVVGGGGGSDSSMAYVYFSNIHSCPIQCHLPTSFSSDSHPSPIRRPVQPC